MHKDQQEISTYRVSNTTSGIVLGDYPAHSEVDAIREMLCDAGNDFANPNLPDQSDDELRAEALTECAYCGRMGYDTVPAIDADSEWDMIAKDHAPDCEWIATRAHRFEVAKGGNFRKIPENRGK